MSIQPSQASKPGKLIKGGERTPEKEGEGGMREGSKPAVLHLHGDFACKKTSLLSPPPPPPQVSMMQLVRIQRSAAESLARVRRPQHSSITRGTPIEKKHQGRQARHAIGGAKELASPVARSSACATHQHSAKVRRELRRRRSPATNSHEGGAVAAANLQKEAAAAPRLAGQVGRCPHPTPPIGWFALVSKRRGFIGAQHIINKFYTSFGNCSANSPSPSTTRAAPPG